MPHLHHYSARRNPSSRVRTEEIRPGCGSSSRSRGHGSGRRDIDALGILCSARVILTTGRLAGGVALGAVVDTLVVGLCTEVVGDCLGVLGCVGGDVVAADALVDEGFLEVPS